MLQCVAVCCSVLQCVAVCCRVLQCVAVRRSALQSSFTVFCSVLRPITFSNLRAALLRITVVTRGCTTPHQQCVAVCCSVLQCVAICPPAGVARAARNGVARAALLRIAVVE